MTKHTPRIRPCPFCMNGKTVVATRNPDGPSHVECTACEARGPTRPTIEQAVKDWNDAIPWGIVRA